MKDFSYLLKGLLRTLDTDSDTLREYARRNNKDIYRVKAQWLRVKERLMAGLDNGACTNVSGLRDLWESTDRAKPHRVG